MNEIQTVTKNVRLQNWTTIIQDRKASGQTVDDYCAANHISRNSYYYWLRKVKEELIQQSPSKFAEVDATFTTTSPDVSPDSSISVCIGDATIHVNESSSGDLLRMVIEAVRHAE